MRGTVLAVNQAYNFVVLNLGGRQGVEPNSEMLVLRGGTPSGKFVFRRLNRPQLSAISLPAAWPVGSRCNPEISSFMLALIRKPVVLESNQNCVLWGVCLLRLVLRDKERNARSFRTLVATRKPPCLGTKQQKWERDGSAAGLNTARRR